MSGPATAFTFEKWCVKSIFWTPFFWHMIGHTMTVQIIIFETVACVFRKIKLLYKIYLKYCSAKFADLFLLLLIGKWRPIFMLDDKIYSRVFYYLDVKQLYEQYLFLYQGDQYRPLGHGLPSNGLCNRSSKLLFVNASNNDGNVVDRWSLHCTLVSIVPLNPGLRSFLRPQSTVAKLRQ